MATLGANAVTLNDWRKRLNAEGKIDTIIEVMAQTNEVLKHMTFMQGNLPTGNMTTQRNGIPKPSIRSLNRAVESVKTSTKQIVDTICCLEAFSEVDEKFKDLQPDFEAFRRSEDVGIAEGFAQEAARLFVYGNSEGNDKEFNGLDIRTRVLSDDATQPNEEGYTVIDAGGTTANKQSSIYLVNFGDRLTTGIFPKNGQAGLRHQDLGKQLTQEADGKMINKYVSQFDWDMGLAVFDPRSIGAIRNIDVAAIANATSAQKAAFLAKIITAHDRIRKPENTFMYVPNAVYTYLKLCLLDKNNVHVELATVENGIRELSVDGMRVYKLDALRTDETVIA